MKRVWSPVGHRPSVVFPNTGDTGCVDRTRRMQRTRHRLSRKLVGAIGTWTLTIVVSIGIVGVELWLVGAGAQTHAHGRTTLARPLQQPPRSRESPVASDALAARAGDWADSVAAPPWIAEGGPSSGHDFRWSGRAYVPLGQAFPGPLLSSSEQPAESRQGLANAHDPPFASTLGHAVDRPAADWASQTLSLQPYLVRSTGGHNVIVTALSRPTSEPHAMSADPMAGAGTAHSRGGETPFAIGRRFAILGACDQRVTVTGIQATTVNRDVAAPHIAVAEIQGPAPQWQVALAVPDDGCDRVTPHVITPSVASARDAAALADAVRRSPRVSRVGAPVFTPHELTAFYTTVDDSVRFMWGVFRHRPMTTQLFPVLPAPVLTVLARVQRGTLPAGEGSSPAVGDDTWQIVWAMLDTMGVLPRPILGVYDINGTGQPQAFVFHIADRQRRSATQPVGDGAAVGDVIQIGQDSIGRWTSLARWTP